MRKSRISVRQGILLSDTNLRCLYTPALGGTNYCVPHGLHLDFALMSYATLAPKFRLRRESKIETQAPVSRYHSRKDSEAIDEALLDIGDVGTMAKWK